MAGLLSKSFVENEPGKAGKRVFIAHGAYRLFLVVDRRGRNTDKPRRAFYFCRDFRGQTLQIKIGDALTHSVENAEKIAKEWDVECDRGNDPREVEKGKVLASAATRMKKHAGGVKLSEVWQAYLDHRQADEIKPLKPLTVRDYKKHINKTLASWADSPVRLLTTKTVADRYKGLVAKHGAAQANQAMRSLSAVLNWSMDDERYAAALEKNPAAKLSLHTIKARKNSLERGQLRSWWSACENIGNDTAKVYLRFLLLTGARREEALSLRWVDVDATRWNTCIFRDTKNGDDRKIPLTEFVARMLDSLPRENEFVFYSATSASGRMTEPAKHIARIAAETGLHKSSHDLRKSFATLTEWAELPSGAVKQVLGHKSSGVTEEHYKERPLDLLRMLLQRYEDFILKESGQTAAQMAVVTQLAAVTK